MLDKLLNTKNKIKYYWSRFGMPNVRLEQALFILVQFCVFLNDLSTPSSIHEPVLVDLHVAGQ